MFSAPTWSVWKVLVMSLDVISKINYFSMFLLSLLYFNVTKIAKFIYFNNNMLNSAGPCAWGGGLDGFQRPLSQPQSTFGASFPPPWIQKKTIFMCVGGGSLDEFQLPLFQPQSTFGASLPPPKNPKNYNFTFSQRSSPAHLWCWRNGSLLLGKRWEG